MKESKKHQHKTLHQHIKQVKIPLRRLSDGRHIPAFGLGTMNLSENDVVEVVHGAIMHGYRLIDTSPVHCNEKAIGRALKDSFE